MRKYKFRAFIPSPPPGRWDGHGPLMRYSDEFIEVGEFFTKMLNHQIFFEVYIMEWTGLKDIKGTDIYEADLVDIDFEYKGRMLLNKEVVFKHGMFGVEEGIFIGLDGYRVTVSGNKYEVLK